MNDKDTIKALQDLVVELQDPRPKHLHRDPKTGMQWGCRSPYCESPADVAIDAPEIDDPRGIHGRRV